MNSSDVLYPSKILNRITSMLFYKITKFYQENQITICACSSSKKVLYDTGYK